MEKKFKVKKLREALDLINTIDLSVNDKLAYAAKKWKKNYDSATKSLFEEANEEVEEQKVLAASIDKSGNLIVNDRNQYAYTPEKWLEFTKKTREINREYEEKMISFIPYLIDKNSEEFKRGKEMFDEDQTETLMGLFFEEVIEIKN